MTKTHEEFCIEIYNRFKGNIVVIGTYVEQHTEIEFYCKTCNINFFSTPQSILHSTYGCKQCGYRAAKKKLMRKNIEINGKLFDKYPNIAKQWNYKMNVDIDINDISPKSGQQVWWTCAICGEPYQAKVCGIVNGTGRCICHSCYTKSLPQVKVDAYLKSNGSFAEHYPDLMLQWDYEKNQGIDPMKLTDKSNKTVWWKCNTCGYSWSTIIAIRTAGEGCPRCVRHARSSLQIKIENYIQSTYNYKLLNEHKCNLRCKNPQTGYWLLYDNELIIDANTWLIIECHGQQHYDVCGWTYTQAKEEKCSPEEILKYQQWKDTYKKDYALSQGYYYLEIPYWTERDESYKTLIDSKIHEILTLTTQQNN